MDIHSVLVYLFWIVNDSLLRQLNGLELYYAVCKCHVQRQSCIGLRLFAFRVDRRITACHATRR